MNYLCAVKISPEVGINTIARFPTSIFFSKTAPIHSRFLRGMILLFSEFVELVNAGAYDLSELL